MPPLTRGPSPRGGERGEWCAGRWRGARTTLPVVQARKRAQEHIRDVPPARPQGLWICQWEAMNCRDCEAFRSTGIDAFAWLISGDIVFRESPDSA